MINDILTSRYFVRDDSIMDSIKFNELVFEIKNRGWWSRVYEYKWMVDVATCYFKGSFDNKNSLDVATGIQHPGMFILKLLGFQNVVGTDIFNDVDFLYRKNIVDGMAYIRDDILNPKLPTKFDFITCISFLEHLPPENQDCALINMLNYLKDDGCIALTFDMPGYEYKTNVEMYKTVLRENGMEYIEVDVNNSDIMTTRDCKNVSKDLYDLNLSCYRIFAKKGML